MDKPASILSPFLRVLMLTAGYAALLFLILPYHEVWRDEMHDLSMVMSWKSLPDLFINTSKHGFPALWYLVLFFGYHLTHSVLILKLASITFVTAAVYLFLRFAPFSGLEKFLFVFGYFPFYEYSIISRSYGLSLLLLFTACTFYGQRFQNIFPFAVSVFLLANTNAHSLILVLALLTGLIVRSFLNKSALKNKKQWFAGLGLIAAGIALALFQIWPDPASTIKYYDLGPAYLSRAVEQALGNPGILYTKILPLPTAFVSLSLFVICFASLRKNISTGIFFFLSALGLSLFFLTVYPSTPRHQGFLVLALMALFWMERADEAAKDLSLPLSGITGAAVRYRDAFFLVLLALQMVLGYQAVARDIAWPHSSSGFLAAYLRQEPQLREAVLIPEPDYMGEALPFYAPHNPLYFPREHRYGTYINFTTANDAHLTLGGLLDAAHKVQREQGKPVVLMISHVLNPEGPFRIHFSYGKTFDYSLEELKRLATETKLLKQFRNAYSDENYEIFLLNPEIV